MLHVSVARMALRSWCSRPEHERAKVLRELLRSQDQNLTQMFLDIRNAIPGSAQAPLDALIDVLANWEPA